MFKTMIVSSALVLLVALTAEAVEVTKVEDCKCWGGYEAKKSDDGKVMCHGLMVFALKPCNLPQPPQCKCTQEKPTGILTDNEGTWCSINEKGVLVKKWACENADEWAKYKGELEKYEKTV